MPRAVSSESNARLRPRAFVFGRDESHVYGVEGHPARGSIDESVGDWTARASGADAFFSADVRCHAGHSAASACEKLARQEQERGSQSAKALHNER